MFDIGSCAVFNMYLTSLFSLPLLTKVYTMIILMKFERRRKTREMLDQTPLVARPAFPGDCPHSPRAWNRLRRVFFYIQKLDITANSSQSIRLEQLRGFRRAQREARKRQTSFDESKASDNVLSIRVSSCRLLESLAYKPITRSQLIPLVD